MERAQPFDLREFYRRIFEGSADEELITVFAEHSRVITKKKGEVIFSPNKALVSSHILLDGVMKTYVVSPNGTENTLDFFFKPGTGFTMNQETIEASGLWCKALTRCTLVEMTPSLFSIAEDYPVLWKRLVLGWRPFYYGTMDKLRAGYTLNAKERYLWFVERYGPIVDVLSLKEISLYLGIQPQSLSRIRNEVAEEAETMPEEVVNMEGFSHED